MKINEPKIKITIDEKLENIVEEIQNYKFTTTPTKKLIIEDKTIDCCIFENIDFTNIEFKNVEIMD